MLPLHWMEEQPTQLILGDTDRFWWGRWRLGFVVEHSKYKSKGKDDYTQTNNQPHVSEKPTEATFSFKALSSLGSSIISFKIKAYLSIHRAGLAYSVVLYCWPYYFLPTIPRCRASSVKCLGKAMTASLYADYDFKFRHPSGYEILPWHLRRSRKDKICWPVQIQLIDVLISL